MSFRDTNVVSFVEKRRKMADDVSVSGVAILTSGGDAQGMNAAVRAVIRYLDYHNTPVFSIMEGYEGLCTGMIKQMRWKDVMGILSRGGTIIGTARCAAFKTHEGRQTAAYNLISRKINNLIIIGGDGSLTGASIFKKEWPRHVAELLEKEKIDKASAELCSHLNIVGMVGSIDNDLCGTDMTIGTDSALHRIVDAVDCLASTADSHMRTFIVEVMGRHCGYLALMSSIATACDWVFVPESPPDLNWEEILVKRMEKKAVKSKRFGLIIIAEGAEDMNGKPIKANYVKDLLTRHDLDVRVTVLGHVQRGGQPSAFDRILASRLGCEAANVILEGVNSKSEVPPCIVSLHNNKIIRLPLLAAIDKTLAVKDCVQRKDFVEAQNLRGAGFSKKVDLCRILSVTSTKPGKGTKQLNIGVAGVGTPASGVNSGIRAIAKVAAYNGHKVTVFHEGVDGMLSGTFNILLPETCEMWSMYGGNFIGSTRTKITSENIMQVRENLKKSEIDCLVLFGGFESIESCLALTKAETDFPVYVVPATISNNVPGSDFSIGCDTALNAIVGAINTIKQSAASTRKRVFIVEVMGGNSGYLAVLSGLASGADAVYIPEEHVNIDTLQCDAYRVMDKIAQGIVATYLFWYFIILVYMVLCHKAAPEL